jgi:hypothetical protein
MQTTYNPRSQQSIDQIRNVSQGVSVQDSNQNANLWSQVGLAIARALGTNIDSRETSASSPSETNIPWNYIATSLVNNLQQLADSYIKKQEMSVKEQEISARSADNDYRTNVAEKTRKNIEENLDKTFDIYKRIIAIEDEVAKMSDPNNQNPSRELSKDYWENNFVKLIKTMR